MFAASRNASAAHTAEGAGPEGAARADAKKENTQVPEEAVDENEESQPGMFRPR